MVLAAVQVAGQARLRLPTPVAAALAVKETLAGQVDQKALHRPVAVVEARVQLAATLPLVLLAMVVRD